MPEEECQSESLLSMSLSYISLLKVVWEQLVYIYWSAEKASALNWVASN